MEQPDASQAVAAIDALSDDVGHGPARRATSAFLELLPDRLQGCLEGDARVAHTLAGAAHMLGLTDLATRARDVEIALEATMQTSADQAVAALVAVAKRDAAALARYLGTAAPPIL